MLSDPILHDDEQARLWLAALATRGTRHAVDVDGCDVVWYQFGQGEPLVLLHGGHGSWTHWARNIDALSARFSLWVPDLPGYGESGLPHHGDWDSLVDATIRSIDVLLGADTPFNLAGFSFGGLVSANIAARRSGVRRLALLGPGGHGGPRRPRGKLLNWKKMLEPEDVKQALRHNLWVHMLCADDAIDPLAQRIHTVACDYTRFRSRTISQMGGLQEVIDQYPGETLFIWGENEVTCTPEYLIEQLVQPHSNRQARIVPGGGHWIQYEEADTINRLLLDWF